MISSVLAAANIKMFIVKIITVRAINIHIPIIQAIIIGDIKLPPKAGFYSRPFFTYHLK